MNWKIGRVEPHLIVSQGGQAVKLGINASGLQPRRETKELDTLPVASWMRDRRPDRQARLLDWALAPFTKDGYNVGQTDESGRST